jgi:DNA-binding transcriptional regulator YiaG
MKSLCDSIGISAKTSTRKSYSWQTKRDILLKIDACRAHPTICFPQTTIAKALLVPKSMLSKWEKQREHIFDKANNGCGNGLRQLRDSIGQFPTAEDMLYMYARFIKTRFLDRLPVNHEWIRDDMRDIVKRLNPD